MKNDKSSLRIPHTFLWTLAGLLLPAIADATTMVVIYENRPPSLDGGNNMGIAWQADTFTLLSRQSLKEIQFWTLEAAGEYRGSISWQIRNSASNLPGNTIFDGIDGDTSVSRASTGRTVTIDTIAYAEFLYSFSLPPLALEAGDYWLNLHNGNFSNLGDPNDFLWSWTDNSLATVTGMESYDDGASWSDNFQHHAFTVTALPEPGTLSALALGLAAWGFMRNRASAPHAQAPNNASQ